MVSSCSHMDFKFRTWFNSLIELEILHFLHCPFSSLFGDFKRQQTILFPVKVSDVRCICLKFIYSEKFTKFCKISTLLLSYVVLVKSKVEILQNFMAFSKYMNFNCCDEKTKHQVADFESDCYLPRPEL